MSAYRPMHVVKTTSFAILASVDALPATPTTRPSLLVPTVDQVTTTPAPTQILASAWQPVLLNLKSGVKRVH